MTSAGTIHLSRWLHREQSSAVVSRVRLNATALPYSTVLTDRRLNCLGTRLTARFPTRVRPSTAHVGPRRASRAVEAVAGGARHRRAFGVSRTVRQTEATRDWHIAKTSFVADVTTVCNYRWWSVVPPNDLYTHLDGDRIMRMIASCAADADDLSYAIIQSTSRHF